jgi:hypothetical protein
MQQLKVEHENTTKKDRRSGKGRVIALSRRIYRLMQTDIFYVESESTDNVYYFVKFKPDVIELCTCPDNSMRTGGGQIKCKHLYAIEFAIKMGTLRDTERLPPEAKVRKTIAVTLTIKPKSYTEDDYSF